MLTYSQRKSFARAGAAALEADVAAAVESERDRKAREHQSNVEAARARNAAKGFTAEQLAAARLIRTRTGWHRVVRVNAKSVTVETAYSWTDRFDLSKVLEVRS